MSDIHKGNRKDALSLGIKFYDNGKMCPKGHGSVRYSSHGTCPVCAREACKERREKDPEQERIRRRKYEKENKDKIAQKSKRYRNSEAGRKYRKNYRTSAHGKAIVNKCTRERRAVRSNATPTWLDEKDFQMMGCLSLIRERVLSCTGIDLHIDHFYPIKGKTVCGLHVPWNLRLVPKTENIKKSNKHPEEIYHG